MPVSNEHLEDIHRVWDGMEFRIMPRKEARELVKQGIAQIADNLQACELKTALQFNEAREKLAVETKVELPPGVEPKRKKRNYKTRQMKAEK